MSSELEELTKLPGESQLFDMQFEKRMATSETISSITATSFVNEGRVDSSTDITLGDTAFSGNVAQLRISGGTANEQYTIQITALTSLGNTKIGHGLLRVE